MFYKDIMSGIILIFLYIIGVKSIQKIHFFEPTKSIMHGIGPAFFPYLLLNLLVISGGILIIIGSYGIIKHREKFNIPSFNWQKLRIYFNIILFILSIFVYQEFFPILGFFLTTFLFLCICVTWFYFIFINPKITKGYLFQLFTRIIIINIVITIFIYLVFFFIAKVPLPKGIYGG